MRGAIGINNNNNDNKQIRKYNHIDNNNDHKNGHNNNNNSYDKKQKCNTISPGHGPIGVLDPSLGCVWKVPRPRKVGGPGLAAANIGATRSSPPRAYLRQGHGGLVFAMDPVDALTIIPKNEGI